MMLRQLMISFPLDSALSLGPVYSSHQHSPVLVARSKITACYKAFNTQTRYLP